MKNLDGVITGVFKKRLILFVSLFLMLSCDSSVRLLTKSGNKIYQTQIKELDLTLELFAVNYSVLDWHVSIQNKNSIPVTLYLERANLYFNSNSLAYKMRWSKGKLDKETWNIQPGEKIDLHYVSDLVEEIDQGSFSFSAREYIKIDNAFFDVDSVVFVID